MKEREIINLIGASLIISTFIGFCLYVALIFYNDPVRLSKAILKKDKKTYKKLKQKVIKAEQDYLLSLFTNDEDYICCMRLAYLILEDCLNDMKYIVQQDIYALKLIENESNI